MSSSFKRNESGAALIMVLMIVAIMTVVVTSTVYQNRLLIKEAELQQNYAKAIIQIKTVKAELIYQLTTSSLFLTGVNSKVKEEQQLPKDFNFYGYPFSYLDAEIKIQASSGLVSLEPFDKKGFISLLTHFNVEPKEQVIITDSFQDWVDTDNFTRLNGAEWRFYGERSIPRNSVMQTLDELLMVRGMNQELWEKMKPYLILFGYGELSARFTSNELLPLIRSEFDTKTINETREQLRGSGQDPLYSLYGDGSQYPSNRMVISIAITHKEHIYQESFTLARGVGDSEPYIITDSVVGTYGN